MFELVGMPAISVVLAVTRGLPWWGWLLIILAVFVLLTWFLSRDAGRSKESPLEPPEKVTPPEAPAAAPVESVQTAPVEPVQAAPVAMPPARSEQIQLTEAVGEDNLQIVEGIGPKIASILHAAGITTFAQLAASDPARLLEIIHAAGLRLGDPTTWPEQARLAAAGDWDGLKRLQDSLKGGRRV